MSSAVYLPGDADRRALLAAAVCALALPLVLPRQAWTPALALATAAAVLAAIYHGYASEAAAKSATSPPLATGATDASSRRLPKGKNKGYVVGDSLAFAPVDPELYTLRAPAPPDLVHDPRPRRTLRHLALRGPLLDVVRKAARLGARNGNTASGARAMVALEDFFARYHRALLSKDAEFAARTLETLRDTRAVALNAIEDLALTVPLSLGRPVRAASEAARAETLRCMSTLAAKHAPSLSPALASAAWGAPLAHDARRGQSTLF